MLARVRNPSFLPTSPIFKHQFKLLTFTLVTLAALVALIDYQMGDPFHDPFNFLGTQPKYSFEPGISARRRVRQTNEDDEDDSQQTENKGSEYALQYQLEEEQAIQEVSSVSLVNSNLISMLFTFRQLFWNTNLRSVECNRRTLITEEQSLSLKN